MSDTKSLNDSFVMQTYAKFNLEIVRGKNSKCWDDRGREYIDFTSGIGVNSLGFCPDAWLDAVTKQASVLQHTSNLYYTSPSAILAKTMCDATGYKRVFFSNSGAEANEGAIKLARKYSFGKYGSSRSNIICLKNSFHGRTITTLSATGQDVFHQHFFPFTEGFLFAEANNIESLKALLDGSVCGVMIEFIQGEGGVNNLDKAFVKEVEKLCKDNDILLIADEVQTGVGRTGKILASEHFNLLPDITTLAKGLGGGLPIGAVLAKEGCENVLLSGNHATTFGANPVVCAGAKAVFDVIRTSDFLSDVTKKSEYIKTKLTNIKGVKSLSGTGLMLGIELSSKSASSCLQECLCKGLLILTAKHKIRLLPPLNISYEDIDAGIEILKEVIER